MPEWEDLTPGQRALCYLASPLLLVVVPVLFASLGVAEIASGAARLTHRLYRGIRSHA